MDQTKSVKRCNHCQTEFNPEAAFCHACGNKLVVDLEPEVVVARQLEPLFLYLGAFVGLFLISAFVTSEKFLFWFWIVVFTTITWAFCLHDWRQIRPLLTISKINPVLFLIVGVLAFGFAFGEFYALELIWPCFFNEEGHYYEEEWRLFENWPYPFWTMIFWFSVHPAITEELAFRGFLYNHLRKIFNPTTAILVCSLLFFAIHIRWYDALFMLPWAAGLGWLRYRYNTLWYSVFVHFVHNVTVCLLEYPTHW